ncbi:hypothetical protein [Pseudomonas chlororaphis]
MKEKEPVKKPVDPVWDAAIRAAMRLDPEVVFKLEKKYTLSARCIPGTPKSRFAEAAVERQSDRGNPPRYTKARYAG